MRRILLLMALISCLPCLIDAGEPPVSWEKLPITFSDNMVLQRDMPLLFQGKASAGERVTIRIHRKKVSTIADKEGRWQLELPTMAAGGPYKLRLTIGRKKWHFSNVMVGEVWLCSGQSNMAFPLAQAVAEPGDNRHHPQLRFFDMKPRWETTATAWDYAALESIQQYDYFSHSGWSLCSPETAERFSAIAYHFGKQLADSLGVTVGLIHHAVGGSPCEAWIDRQTLTERFPQILSDWTSNELIQDWARERALLNIRNSSRLDQHHPYEPAYLFDAAMEPLASYPIKGVIWYQGESNAHDLESYSQLFPIMIDSWRRYWNNDTLPFCFVQLSSINRPTWPAFRDLQRRQADEIPHTYLTVSSDKGDSLDVHPRQKREIGERLAYSALHHIYNRKEIVPSGPLYESVVFVADTAFVSFRYGNGLTTSYGETVRTVELATADNLFYPAVTTIENDQLKAWSPLVKSPCSIRYAWQPFTRANLINAAGMPASTFLSQPLSTNDMNTIATTQSLPTYPISGGISAPLIGVHKNRLIVGGGCNFPDQPAAQGGQKVYYSDLYWMDLSDERESQWRKGGQLPIALAYSAMVTTDEGVLSIGGQSAEGELTAVYRIRFDEATEEIAIEELPSLPRAVSNGAATRIGQHIYLAGGAANRSLFVLHLDQLSAGWEQIDEVMAEERQQPVLFSHASSLYLAGGYDEKEAVAFTDIQQFSFDTQQWVYLKDIPATKENPRTFVGASAVSISDDVTLFVGGVNYDRFESALIRLKRKQQAMQQGNSLLVEELNIAGREYMSQPVEWYQFNQSLLAYDATNDSWTARGIYPSTARAGAGVTYHAGKLYVVCGELKPGIRTDEVTAIALP